MVVSTHAICFLFYNPTLHDTNPDLHDALLKESGLESTVSDFRNAVLESISSYCDSLVPEE